MKMAIVEYDGPCLECGMWIETSAVRGDIGHYHHKCAPMCIFCGEEVFGDGTTFMNSLHHERCVEEARCTIERERYAEDPIHPWQDP